MHQFDLKNKTAIVTGGAQGFGLNIVKRFLDSGAKVPRGRFLEIEEFTSLICWLSSEENSFSTAAVFDISGDRSTY